MVKIDCIKNKRVLVTGSTGFKGSWLCMWLKKLGADVYGLALPPKYPLGHFNMCSLGNKINQVYADVRMGGDVHDIISDIKPEIIFHLAAQPVVLESFENPTETIDINVMGTANVLDAARQTNSVKSIVVVTSDKCYKNSGEVLNAFNEGDMLGGDDPYSASKACEEMVAQAFYKSFFEKSGVGLATVRAGNVVGGGDRTRDRIVPDIVQAIERNEPVFLRNPEHVRPWQYVLEPLYGYMVVACAMIVEPKKYSTGWNFGPRPSSFATVMDFTEKILKNLPSVGRDPKINLKCGMASKYTEKKLLVLNSDKAEKELGVKNLLNIDAVARMVVEDYFIDMDPYEKCIERISGYEDLLKKVSEKNEM